MNEQMMHDNQALLAFWDSFFALPEEAKEGARQEGIGPDAFCYFSYKTA
jgi:hypothetical protein